MLFRSDRVPKGLPSGGSSSRSSASPERGSQRWTRSDTPLSARSCASSVRFPCFNRLRALTHNPAVIRRGMYSCEKYPLVRGTRPRRRRRPGPSPGHQIRSPSTDTTSQQQYFEHEGVIRICNPSDDLPTIAATSSPDQWSKQARVMYDRQLYRNVRRPAV